MYNKLEFAWLKHFDAHTVARKVGGIPAITRATDLKLSRIIAWSRTPDTFGTSRTDASFISKGKASSQHSKTRN
jgi:hypothetical protein